MALTIPPDPAADSYCTVAVADAYHQLRLNATAWDDATVATKESALRMATIRLESEQWKGLKADELNENSLRWPRSGLYNADAQLVPSNSVPLAIQHAAAELALELIKAAADEAAGEVNPTTDISVGPVSLKLDTSRAVKTAAVELSGNVDALIGPYRTPARTNILVRA